MGERVRDRNGLGIQHGDRVIVQTSPDAEAVRATVDNHIPPTAAIAGNVLVGFDNGTSQWMLGSVLAVVSE